MDRQLRFSLVSGWIGIPTGWSRPLGTSFFFVSFLDYAYRCFTLRYQIEVWVSKARGVHVRERTGGGQQPQVLDWGSLAQEGQKAGNNLRSFQNQATSCVPTYLRECSPAITLSRATKGTFHENPVSRLTARQGNCRDMTQSESPRRLEAPIVTYQWPHPSLINPERGPRAYQRVG